MLKNEKIPIAIDGVEYKYEDMTQDQQMMVNHIVDLDHKIGQAAFNIEQLNVGKNAFVQLLKGTLTPAESVGSIELVEEKAE